MMTPKTRYFLLGSMVLLVIALGGGLIAYLNYGRAPDLAGGVPSELRFIPSDAEVVGYVDVQAVMASELGRELRPTFETGTDSGRMPLKGLFGIDVETQVSQIVGYVESAVQDPATTDAPDPPGGLRLAQARGLMLVQGSFEQPRVEQFIRDQGGTIDQYHGHAMAVHGQGDEQAALGFVRDGLIAVGHADLVRRTLDLSNDDGSAEIRDVTANGELMSLIQDASDSTAWVVGNFDAVSRRMLAPNALTRQVPPLRLVAARAYVNGGARVVVRAEAADQAAGDQLREAVRGFVALARLQAGTPRELEGTINSIELSGGGTTVQLSFALTPEAVRALAPRAPSLPDPAPQR